VPLVFLAAGSSMMAASLAGALFCLVQLWRNEGDTFGWLVAGAIFLGVCGAILPMMVALGYGRLEVRRLLRFYGAPYELSTPASAATSSSPAGCPRRMKLAAQPDSEA
jgi:hypothetical protein